MFRAFLLAFAMFATTPIISSDAFAGSTPKLDKMKEEVKWEKGRSKELEKLAKKWHKNDDKGKDNAEVQGEIKKICLDELASLRDLGVETVEPDLPTHPAHPEIAIDDGDDREKLNTLRDKLVILKTTAPGEEAKKYGNNLDDVTAQITARYERKDKQYDAAKSAK